MDEIGVSLFQDPGNIHINSNDEQLKDEEEDQEERKLKDEINNGLPGVFDDLSDCNSVNSSHYKESTQYSEGNVSVNSISSKFHTAEKNKTPIYNDYEPRVPNVNEDIPNNTMISPRNNYMKFNNHAVNHPFVDDFRDHIYTTPSSRYSDQLNIYPNNGHIEEYDNIGRTFENQTEKILRSQDCIPFQTSVKQHEIDSLRKLLSQKQEEIDILKDELNIKQEQIARYDVTRKEMQQSLDKAKEEIDYLQSQVNTLTEGNEVQNDTIKKLSEDLSVSKAIVIDLEKKIDILESTQINDKKHEKFLKQAQEKYAAEVKNLQVQIDQLMNNLSAKEASYNALEHKFDEFRKRHEAILIENGDKINRLTRALHESQTQCENLVTSKNSHELIQIQTQLDVVLKEKRELLHKVEDLEHKLIVSQNDEMQYLSWLRVSNDEESDSMQQMKLGSLKSKSNSDDIVNKLRGELQRCLEGHSIKRKEINRLDTALTQKQKELDEALLYLNTQRHEAVENAQRVNQLENELKSLLSDQAKKADAKIKKLSDHLNEMKKQNESLKQEKKEIQDKFEETLSINHELSAKLYESTVNKEEMSPTLVNREYLEIHEKAVQQIKEESEVKQMQLEVQLEQTQKSLDHVKQSYIDVCASKEQLIAEHKQEIKLLKEKYEKFELKEQALEKCEQELNKQMKLVEKLAADCEKYRNKIIELEKDIELERRRKTEHANLIYVEIEKAKEEALQELRSAHPNHKINVHLPDYCSEHMDKITELENDCKKLEEKLSAAVEDQRKLSDIQAELDAVRLNLAQTEINKEAWVKKYDNLQKEMVKVQSKYEEVLNERNNCRERLVTLEQDLAEAKSLIESSLKGHTSNSRNDLNDDFSRLKIKSKDSRLSDNLFAHIKQLEKDMQMKNEKVKELEKIKEERDDLVMKLKNQAKQFKQFLKNQKQVSVELSTPTCVAPDDSVEVQKIKEAMIKEVREEMEQKVIEKLKEIEDNHQVTLTGLKKECDDKSKELESLKESMHVEKLQLYESFKKQEQKIVQIIQTRIGEQLQSHKQKIEELQEKLVQKENDIEKERNVMAQLLSNWSTELKIIQNREKELKDEFSKVKCSEENLIAEVKLWKERKQEIDSSLKAVKKKYHCVKKIAYNYKIHAEKKDKQFRNECKRIEESYKKTMAQVQLKVDTIISVQDTELAKKMRDVEMGYAEHLKKLRTKYKQKY